MDPLDPDHLRSLGIIGSPDQEIADSLGISVEDLQPMADLLRKARADRRIALRRAQFKTAIGGNTTLLIVLGKHELGQMEPAGESEENPWAKPWMDEKMG